MSATPDSTLANPEQLIADLRRQLAECKAERDKGRERETATAEVLQVINSSPGDLMPVFDAVLEKAVSLSAAVYGHLWRFDGEHFHPWRSHGDPQFARWFEQLSPVRPNPDGDGFLGRVVRSENVLYIADVRDTEAYRSQVMLSDGPHEHVFCVSDRPACRLSQTGRAALPGSSAHRSGSGSPPAQFPGRPAASLARDPFRLR